MKIAPFTERWNEGERDWCFVKNARPDMERWEKETGLKLPNEYREFMFRFNGGRNYPRMFHTPLVIRQAGPHFNESDVTYIDIILNWECVESIWEGKDIGPGVPPNHIVFGSTPGGIQLLMSLASADYGNVYSWWHSIYPWGSDENKVLVPQANSFIEFLKSLYDDEDKSDYKNWRIPLYDKLAKEFQLDDHK
jgi:hypothetical protein